MTGDVSPQIRYPIDPVPENGAAVQVAPGIFWVRMGLPMTLDHVNAYVLDDGDGWTLVDTGFSTAKTRNAWSDLFSGIFAGKPLRRVIVTHHHPDHIGLAGWFQAEYGATLVTTRTAWLMARMLVLDEQATPSEQTLGFWRAAGMDDERIAERCETRPFNFADVVAPLPLGFQRIADGDTLETGGRSWVVRTGHGHAPEHATLWSLDDDLVLAGDQLLPSISPNLGVYATEPDADPVSEWLASCERFAGHAHNRHFVLPGHKLPFTGLPMRISQLMDNHHGALNRMLDVLDQPRSAVECFAALFKREIGDGEYGLALVEAVAHANHLWKKGEVTRLPGPDGVWLWERTK